MNEHRDNLPPVLRRLSAAGLRVDRRAEGEADRPTRIVGHAAVFDQWTDLVDVRFWKWREIIKPGAFYALKEKQDVRALLNHDDNFVLGRTRSGTLKLEEDETGLLSRIEPPDTQTVRDLVLTPIERGDLSGMSFAFSPRRAGKVTTTEADDGSTVIDFGGLVITERYEGEKLIEEWEVRDVDLFDVSPVTYPAYDGTDVALRGRALGYDLRTLIESKNRPHVRTANAPRRAALKARLESKTC